MPVVGSGQNIREVFNKAVHTIRSECQDEKRGHNDHQEKCGIESTNSGSIKGAQVERVCGIDGVEDQTRDDVPRDDKEEVNAEESTRNPLHAEVIQKYGYNRERS